MNNQDLNQIGRRKFINIASMITAGTLMFPKSIFARQQNPVVAITTAAKTAKITVTKLRGNISMLDGSGGNIAVLSGADGKLLVDTGIAVSQPHILTALNSISKHRIKYVINSHWHFDHADGNEWLHKAGATIIAQNVTKKHLSQTTRVEDWNFTFPPHSAAGLPSRVYENEHHLQFNGEKVSVKTYPHAHTDGDSSIFFANANILHTADTFWNGYYPFIDYSTGGNISGMIAAAKINIDQTTNETLIIPGHGPIAKRQQLIEFYDMLTAVFSKIQILKTQGKSLPEVIALKPTATFDAKFGGFAINGQFFTRLVYKGA